MNQHAVLENAPDEALVALGLERNREAFAELVDRYRSLVCSISFSIVGSIDQSEDIAQETFLVAWTRLKQLSDPSKFRSWVCAIARNTAYGNVRRNQRDARLASGGEDSAETTTGNPSDEMISREETELLWKSLERVPEKYREPLILFYREDQSVAKVATQLGLTTDTVKQRLSRGRAIVRGDLQRRLGDMLAATRPGPTFTAAVIGALPGVLATSAAAAGTGAAGKTVAAGIASGAGAGALGGLAGAFLGWWASDQTARYQSQRDLMKRSLVGILILVAVFLGGGFYWEWGQKAPFFAPGIFALLWMFLFFAVIGFFSWRMGVKSRKLSKREQRNGTKELPVTPARSWLRRWNGRRWNSRSQILGLPLVSIAFTDPDRDFSGVNDLGKGTARGWIALGDKAYGLIAFGNIAAGGIAFGGVAIGLLSFGGLAAGGIAFGGLTLALLSLGGLALGFASLGGFAGGWYACGGAGIGYRAALGGFAAANDFAVGSTAYADHANDEVAKQFIEGNSFFRFGLTYTEFVSGPWFMLGLIAVTIGVTGLILAVGFKRRNE